MGRIQRKMLGATCDAGSCRFLVWAPKHHRVDLHVVAPIDRVEPMERLEHGYHHLTITGLGAGARYFYRLDEGIERPDPASRSQPDGVHGPSEVVDSRQFAWGDQSWRGVPLSKLITYELHVGTFTEEGTFEAIVPLLPCLKDLGITAIEIMPIGQFSGERNWGYDGVYPYAVQDSYGGLEGLQAFVNAAHRVGLSIVLDVVYNHLGPEGNYLGDFAPYFTDLHHTPWGWAVNLDGPGSDEVRRYFIENARHWFEDCHIDALRLDAVHAFLDRSAEPFLKELKSSTSDLATALNRRLYLIAESDLNDSRVVLPTSLGGYGVDAQWSDDLHHSLHALLTGEDQGYYGDFGLMGHLATALQEGFVYSGQYSAFRQRRHGNSARPMEGKQFVVATQTHDQVGNRANGERLSQLVSFESLKLAAATMLLSPYLPLIFMGEEYGETAPFLYFTSHQDPDLGEAVRNGRRNEFACRETGADVPDPQDPRTFQRSKVNWTLRNQPGHSHLLALYTKLLQLRANFESLGTLSKDQVAVEYNEETRTLVARRWAQADEVLIVLCFSEDDQDVTLDKPPAIWDKVFDSADLAWLGPGSSAPDLLTTGVTVSLPVRARSALLYRQQINGAR